MVLSSVGFMPEVPQQQHQGITGGLTIRYNSEKYLNECLESVFAVLGGALLLGERLSSREAFGCLIMFTAVILAQLSPLIKRKA